MMISIKLCINPTIIENGSHSGFMTINKAVVHITLSFGLIKVLYFFNPKPMKVKIKIRGMIPPSKYAQPILLTVTALLVLLLLLIYNTHHLHLPLLTLP